MYSEEIGKIDALLLLKSVDKNNSLTVKGDELFITSYNYSKETNTIQLFSDHEVEIVNKESIKTVSDVSDKIDMILNLCRDKLHKLEEEESLIYKIKKWWRKI